ncbi:hypothetical protein PIB30_013848 [Stylosanthes scabra]|uniref:Uncharacterized protein n=1 Tax=Stylosanthes scabra TaxID=79078 RepID=A0ABU6T689_9FABA|nr:hypothetical protein [Stylosanthes scabra]
MVGRRIVVEETFHILHRVAGHDLLNLGGLVVECTRLTFGDSVVKARALAKFGAEVAKKGERNEKIAKKPRRPILHPVCTDPRAYAYAPLALGGTPRVQNEANAYAPKALVRTHQGISESINRGDHHHFEESPHTISIV